MKIEKTKILRNTLSETLTQAEKLTHANIHMITHMGDLMCMRATGRKEIGCEKDK